MPSAHRMIARRLGDRKIGLVPQHHGDSLPFREPGDRPPHVEPVRRSVLRVGQRTIEPASESPSFDGTPPPSGASEVHGDRHDVGLGCRHVSDTPPARRRAGERLLGQLLSEGDAAGGSSERGDEARPHALAELVLVHRAPASTTTDVMKNAQGPRTV